MYLITCQHEWVEHRKSCYRCEPPTGFHFEDAHYPLSKKMGGEQTVRLWYPDHIIQGCLQTLEYSYPCIDVRKKETEQKIVKATYPEYVPIYEEAYDFCQRFAASRGGTKARDLKLGIHNPKVRKNTGQINAEAKSKSVVLVGPAGQRTVFKSAREAERQTGMNFEVLTRSANNGGKIIIKGQNKGWKAIWLETEIF